MNFERFCVIFAKDKAPSLRALPMDLLVREYDLFATIIQLLQTLFGNLD